MKWHNTKLDKLPKDKQVVLLSFKGVNHVAIYDDRGKCFKVEVNGREKTIKSDENQLYWKEQANTGKKK